MKQITAARDEETRARGEEQAHGERARRLLAELAPLEEALAAAEGLLGERAKKLDELRARLSKLPPPPPPPLASPSSTSTAAASATLGNSKSTKKKGSGGNNSNRDDGAASDVSSAWGTDTDEED